MSNIFFTSDNHFNHKNVMKFCPTTRGGHTEVDAMNNAMIEIWNNTVSLTDTVYCLGDFSFTKSQHTEQILKRLKGRLHLIKGNHDHWLNDDTAKYFESITQYNEVTIDKIPVVMFHYPIAEWNRMHHGAYHLYGHVHSGLTLPGRALDVGIDARPKSDMGLWSWDDIHESLRSREIITHHGKLNT